MNLRLGIQLCWNACINGPFLGTFLCNRTNLETLFKGRRDYLMEEGTKFTGISYKAYFEGIILIDYNQIDSRLTEWKIINTRDHMNLIIDSMHSSKHQNIRFNRPSQKIERLQNRQKCTIKVQSRNRGKREKERKRDSKH